jgi:hypothetical protein
MLQKVKVNQEKTMDKVVREVTMLPLKVVLQRANCLRVLSMETKKVMKKQKKKIDRRADPFVALSGV